MTSIWPSGISSVRLAQRMHAAAVRDGGVLEADRGHRSRGVEGRAQGGDPARSGSVTASRRSPSSLDRLADDLERLEVRLGEGRDL